MVWYTKAFGTSSAFRWCLVRPSNLLRKSFGSPFLEDFRIKPFFSVWVACPLQFSSWACERSSKTQLVSLRGINSGHIFLSDWVFKPQDIIVIQRLTGLPDFHGTHRVCQDKSPWGRQRVCRHHSGERETGRAPVVRTWAQLPSSDFLLAGSDYENSSDWFLGTFTNQRWFMNARQPWAMPADSCSSSLWAFWIFHLKQFDAGREVFSTEWDRPQVTLSAAAGSSFEPKFLCALAPAQLPVAVTSRVWLSSCLRCFWCVPANPTAFPGQPEACSWLNWTQFSRSQKEAGLVCCKWLPQLSMDTMQTASKLQASG